MSKKDKFSRLLKKAQESRNNIKLKELKLLAEHHGFVYDTTTGDHAQYKRKDDPYGFINLQPDKKNRKMAKGYQVKQLVDFIVVNLLEERDKHE